MNQQEFDKHVARIRAMDQKAAASFWRFASSSDPIIQNPELWKIYEEHFKSLGGMTPEISKSLGW